MILINELIEYSQRKETRLLGNNMLNDIDWFDNRVYCNTFNSDNYQMTGEMDKLLVQQTEMMNDCMKDTFGIACLFISYDWISKHITQTTYTNKPLNTQYFLDGKLFFECELVFEGTKVFWKYKRFKI